MPEISEIERPRNFPLDSFSTRPTKRNVIFFLLIVLLVGVLAARFPTLAAIAIPLLIAVPLSFFFTYELFLVFSFLLLSLGDYFGSEPIMLGGFKLYGADGFLVLLIILLIKLSKSERQKVNSPLSLLLWIYIAYGIISLLTGLFYQNHELSRAIGDFRRFFYYPLAFFLGWHILREKKDIIKLEKIIQLAPVIIMGLAARRLITGQTWAPEIHAKPEDFRAIPYFDGITLLFVLSYLVALFFAKRRLSLFQLTIAFLIPIFIVLSGFRLLWALFLLSFILVLWFTFRWKSQRRYTRILLYIFLIVLISMAFFRMAGGKYYDMFEENVIERIVRYEHSSERWRYPAWRSAIDKFKDSPITGTGLGDEPTFWATNSAGQWMKITRTLHNAFLEILYQTGFIGAFLFLLIIGKYSLHIYQNLKLIDTPSRPIMIALFILFICGLIQSLFQPYLNHPGNGVLFFSFMGASMKMIRLLKT